MSAALILAWLTLAALLATAAEMAVGHRRIVRLESVVGDAGGLPNLSVVVPARNEELHIEEALQSVLALDYPNLEVIVVNDRSTDGTGTAIDRLTRSDRRVRRIEITSLPAGWLGKNYALHRGAAAASGEWILFTDADVVYDHTTARRAMSYVRRRELDHLTASALVTGPTLSVRLFISAFAFFFLLYSRPWRATSRNPRDHVGIGAFNLVRASLYRKAGGHRRIAMRTDDDMRLAELLKREGGREELVAASALLKVEWYASVRDAVAGLEKNAFAGLNYSVLQLAGATLAQFTLILWPWVAAAAGTGMVRALNLATVVVMLLLVGSTSARVGGRAAYALAFPLAAMVFMYAIWNSALKALIRGGVEWRGTFYRLRELRANAPAPPGSSDEE